MTVWMKSHIFDLIDSIFIIGIWSNFKLTCDANGIPQRAETWFFNFFVNKSASAVLNEKLATKHKALTRKNLVGRPKPCRFIRRLWIICYAFILRHGAWYCYVRSITKKKSIAVRWGADGQALQYRDVYVKQELNEIFVDRIHKSIRWSMISYSTSRKMTSRHDLAVHATSILKLQGGRQGLKLAQLVWSIKPIDKVIKTEAWR